MVGKKSLSSFSNSHYSIHYRAGIINTSQLSRLQVAESGSAGNFSASHEAIIHKRALFYKWSQNTVEINWSLVDLKSMPHQVELNWVTQNTRSFTDNRHLEEGSFQAVRQIYHWSQWSSEPHFVHTKVCRRTLTSSCENFCAPNRHQGWFSGEGYCRDKREHLRNCLEYLEEIKKILESQAKIYTSHPFKKILGVWRMRLVLSWALHCTYQLSLQMKS